MQILLIAILITRFLVQVPLLLKLLFQKLLLIYMTIQMSYEAFSRLLDVADVASTDMTLAGFDITGKVINGVMYYATTLSSDLAARWHGSSFVSGRTFDHDLSKKLKGKLLFFYNSKYAKIYNAYGRFSKSAFVSADSKQSCDKRV